jgi:hypothetical protein
MGEVVAALESEPSPQEYVSTGSLVLDMALHGWPVGRVSEITGDSMSGKTTLAYVAAAEMQKLGEGPVLWLDFRGEFSPRKAEQAGVNTGALLVVHGMPRWDLGPIKHVVADVVTGWEDAERCLAIAAEGRTVVATTWRYRRLPGIYPWVDLSLRSGNHTTATVRTELSGEATVAGLEITPNGIDSGMELLGLAQKAGMIDQRGSHWYLRRKGSPTTEHLGSGREAAARELTRHYKKISGEVLQGLTRT